MKIKHFKNYALLSILTLSLFSCRDNGKMPDDVAKAYITDIMTDIYYWYDKMPSNVDSKNKDIFEHFDMLLYSQDRWSWMMTGKEYIEDETGVYISWGISLKQPIDHYNDYDIKIAYIHPDSPFTEEGVERGWTLTHINNVPVMQLVNAQNFDSEYNKSPNNFTFRDREGGVHTFDISSRTISTRSSLGYQVFTSEDFDGLTSPVGYFNYLTFNDNMLSDIDAAMAHFKSLGVKELILDLRYNGGGSGKAMEYLANYIAPASADGKFIALRRHNDKLTSWDNDSKSVIKRINGKSLDLERIFFITGKGTASASEVLINGFSPLMNVVQVGGVTYGKPNGMYVIAFPEDNYTSPEYVFLPIAYFTVNGEGNGNYVDGLTPDNKRADDLYHNFGVTEDNIKACLSYVVNNSFPSLPTKAATKSSSGHRIKTEVDKPGYGSYKVKFSADR